MRRDGSRSNLSSSTSRIKEINYIVPDRQDLLKEKLKYSWRRLIFYVFFFFLVFNVSYYPDQTKVNPPPPQKKKKNIIYNYL